MKAPHQPHISKNGFTLLEMTIVIMVLLAMIKTGFFVSSKMNEWKLGRQASETLRTVYSAQRMYLADNPTVDVTKLTMNLDPLDTFNIFSYLPNKPATIPTVKSLTGTNLVIVVNSSPPYLTQSGIRYDPASPANYTDSLWDVGE